MNKSELIEALAAKTEVSKAAAGKSIDALLEIITASVAKGNDVALIGFGTFKAGAGFKAAVAPKKKAKK